MKQAGILMPVASLPNDMGCGTFGGSAYEFVDLMEEAGLSVWQILPLFPLDQDNSPYAPYSSYAMDDIYIDLSLLKEGGLIQKELKSYHKNNKLIDYPSIRKFREPYLREAFSNFKKTKKYKEFASQACIRNYAVFLTLKKANPDCGCWYEWPEDMKDEPTKHGVDLAPYEDEIDYTLFLQYELFVQWEALKKYANKKGIRILGDIPFYAGMESADVWSNRDQFLLDDDGRPDFIAGVPPDYFSATGQRWGNPIYDWEKMEKDGFKFWMERLSYTGKLFDIVRVDHFRAFDTYWKIPSECETAIGGEWFEAPGYALFDTLFEKEKDLEIIAEDLGYLREEVHQLRDHYHFRGMRVVQFSFDPKDMKEDKDHLVIYTGTHDNATITGWFAEMNDEEKNAINAYLKEHGFRNRSYVDNIIDYTLASNADMAIIPMGDWLHLPKEARINVPGTSGSPNWMFRLNSMEPFRKKVPDIRNAVVKSGRNVK